MAFKSRGDAMKRFWVVGLTVLLLATGVAGRDSTEVRFESVGTVQNLREVPISSVKTERFRGRRVQVWQLDSRNRFVTLDDDKRTDLEFWTLEPSGWRVAWTEALIEQKEPFADRAPNFAGTVPQLVQVGPQDFVVGVLSSRRTAYSGGGGMNTYLNLYRVREPRAILRESLVAASKTIRACFSEADYNSGGPCSDEYNASGTLKFFGSRNGMYRLKKQFTVELLPKFRKPSDPSGDTSQADRLAVCAPYNLEYEWNPQQLEFVSLWPEPDSCAL
jgi:hypothetical protein